jgi:hypothetical protein
VNAEQIDRRYSQTQERYAADDLETMQAARRYGDHVFQLFRPHIGRRVLEVGSGIGTMSRRLTAVSDMVVGIEECDPLELAARRFDTVFCSNVLEHIEDDVAALATFKDVLSPGGRVLIFVPAVPSAYGPLDAELGHHRRYSKRTLAVAFGEAGLDLAILRYTNPIGLLGWLYNARIRKATTHQLGQVRLFETLVAPWALPLERIVTPPIGLSLVAVGVKHPTGS